MDSTQFDRLARTMAQSASRRATIAALVGGLLSPLLSSPDGEARRKRGNQRDRDTSRHDSAARPRSQNQRRGRKPSADRGHQPAAEATAGCCGTKSCSPPAAASYRSGCNYESQTFTDLRAEGTNASKINGLRMTVAGGNWRRVNFDGACLQGAVFTGDVDLRESNFWGACLVDADLRGARVDGSVNFTNAILCRTKLPSGINLAPDRDCTRGAACCAACDGRHPCPAGQVCCNGKCVSGNCCSNTGCTDPTKPICRNNTCRPCTQNTQCPSGVCCNGVCCRDRQTCTGGACSACNAETCSSGCCDAQRGCVSPPTNDLCGTGGASCAPCGGITPVCDSGRCVGCTQSSQCDRNRCQICQGGQCVFECGGDTPVCDGSGLCVECVRNTDCNQAGCERCNTQTNTCVSTCGGETPSCNGSGACVCTAGSCPSGCCNGTTCQPGDTNQACGASGVCRSCDTSQCQTCEQGVCAGCDPLQCETCTSSGCASLCDPNQCQVCNGAGQCVSGCPVGSTCLGQGQCCPQPRPCNGICCPEGQQCVSGRCCPFASTCGAVCCPDGQPCFGGQCCPGTRICGGGVCCPEGQTCLGSECCPGDRICSGGVCCPEGQPCIGGQCCPPANICGNMCLAAPCDLQRCETCNPQTGTCAVCGGPNTCLVCNNSGTCFSTCQVGQLCDGNGQCVCNAMSCQNGTCIDNQCCPSNRLCGGRCLPRPCNLEQFCETCNPQSGTCEVCGGPGTCLFCNNGTCFSNCPPGKICNSQGQCV